MARAAAVLHSDRRASEVLYREAVALDPTLHEAWFDLGLICKWARRWDEAFECNLRAAEQLGERAEEPAWWNLGIAATALRRWDVAHRAWRAYGIAVDDDLGELGGDFGYGPVRLNPGDDGEVVWGRRIDPARIRLESIPFPRSGHRWGDVVLHDGAPSGYRELDGQQVPVFDELERWAVSDVPTIQVAVSARHPDDVDQLLTALEHAGLAAEDWTRSVRMLCRRCSEGTVHPEHSDDALAAGREHLIGAAGSRAALEDVVRQWQSGPDRVCHTIDEAT